MVTTGLRHRISGLRDGLESRLVRPASYLCEATLMSVLRRRGGTIPLRVCLVSDGSEITSEEQFNPFAAYRAELRRQLGVISLKETLNNVLRSPQKRLALFDIVILKLSFRKNRSEALAIAKNHSSGYLRAPDLFRRRRRSMRSVARGTSLLRSLRQETCLPRRKRIFSPQDRQEQSDELYAREVRRLLL